VPELHGGWGSEETALRESSLQGAYFILALRAQGLDCGPTSGFDAAKVDDAFFPGGWRTNFLLNIGYGNRGPAPSQTAAPRLSRSHALGVVVTFTAAGDKKLRLPVPRRGRCQRAILLRSCRCRCRRSLSRARRIRPV
jgi:nitroreductase